MDTKAQYNDTVVRQFAIMTVVWGVVGMLAGVFIDTEKYSRSLRVEASRRLGDSWRLELELQTFTNIDEQDPLIAFEDDDFLLVELAYYF